MTAVLAALSLTACNDGTGAHDEGAWVRDAATAYARKHARVEQIEEPAA